MYRIIFLLNEYPRPAKLSIPAYYYVEPPTPKSTSGAKLSDESVQRPNLLQLQRLRLETPPESTETPPLPYYI
jgi:hypothetical protein